MRFASVCSGSRIASNKPIATASPAASEIWPLWHTTPTRNARIAATSVVTPTSPRDDVTA